MAAIRLHSVTFKYEPLLQTKPNKVAAAELLRFLMTANGCYLQRVSSPEDAFISPVKSRRWQAFYA